MRLSLFMLVAAAATTLAATRPARAEDLPADPDEKPASGVPYLVVGGILLGQGLVTALASPLYCGLSAVENPFQAVQQRSSQIGTCYGVFLGVSGTAVATAITLLVIGGTQRHRYNEWRKDRDPPSPVKVIYDHASLVLTQGGSGVVVGWHAAF